MEQRVETSDRTVGNFVLFWMPHHSSHHLSCISHEINNFQKCFVQERDILHFTDLFILRGLEVMTFKKIACEGDTFLLIASSSFSYGGYEMWIHIIIDGSNGKCRGAAWKERQCCQEQTLNFLPVLFPQIKSFSEGLAHRRDWGKGEERWLFSRGGLSFIKFLNCCHNLAIFFCQRKHDSHYLQFSYYVSVDYPSLFPPLHMWNYIFLNSYYFLSSSGAFSITVPWLWPLTWLWPWLVRMFLTSPL